jgi:hypothetical protein
MKLREYPAALAHDESAKDLVEPVAILRLADYEILQLGVLHPHRVRRLDPRLEGHRLPTEQYNYFNAPLSVLDLDLTTTTGCGT